MGALEFAVFVMVVGFGPSCPECKLESNVEWTVDSIAWSGEWRGEFCVLCGVWHVYSLREIRVACLHLGSFFVGV